MIPLRHGLHELPTCVRFATCPTSWEQGRGSGRGGGASFPLPCPPVPLGPPENVSAMRNGSQALVRWQEPRVPLQGTLLGYRLAYRGQDTPEVGAAGRVRVEWLWEGKWGEMTKHTGRLCGSGTAVLQHAHRGGSRDLTGLWRKPEGGLSAIEGALLREA